MIILLGKCFHVLTRYRKITMSEELYTITFLERVSAEFLPVLLDANLHSEPGCRVLNFHKGL